MVQRGIARNQFSEKFEDRPRIVDGFVPSQFKGLGNGRRITVADGFIPLFIRLSGKPCPTDQHASRLLDAVRPDSGCQHFAVALVSQFDSLAGAGAEEFRPCLPAFDGFPIDGQQFVVFLQACFFGRTVSQDFADAVSNSKRQKADVALVFRNFTCFRRAGGINYADGLGI